MALVICLVQFKIGRMLGRRYGDAVAGGQSLGQKEYGAGGVDGPGLPEPVSSIAPTAYIAWQTW